jgi:hypothetical protein
MDKLSLRPRLLKIWKFHLCTCECVFSFAVVARKLDLRESPDYEESHINGSDDHRPLTTNDLFLKDAFLVFRAMCKLTMKPLNAERSAIIFPAFYPSFLDLLAISVNVT